MPYALVGGPKCGRTIAILSVIEQEDQTDGIERLPLPTVAPVATGGLSLRSGLKHCQLWNGYPARAPPKPAATGEFELKVGYTELPPTVSALL